MILLYQCAVLRKGGDVCPANIARRQHLFVFRLVGQGNLRQVHARPVYPARFKRCPQFVRELAFVSRRLAFCQAIIMRRRSACFIQIGPTNTFVGFVISIAGSSIAATTATSGIANASLRNPSRYFSGGRGVSNQTLALRNVFAESWRGNKCRNNH